MSEMLGYDNYDLCCLHWIPSFQSPMYHNWFDSLFHFLIFTVSSSVLIFESVHIFLFLILCSLWLDLFACRSFILYVYNWFLQNLPYCIIHWYDCFFFFLLSAIHCKQDQKTENKKMNMNNREILVADCSLTQEMSLKHCDHPNGLWASFWLWASLSSSTDSAEQQMYSSSHSEDAAAVIQTSIYLNYSSRGLRTRSIDEKTFWVQFTQQLRDVIG